MKFCFDEHPAHFGALFGYCDHQVHKLMGRMLKRYDVSPMQCRTLTYLHRQTGDVTQKMLQQHLMVRPSTVNGIVDRLEEKGLVTRSTGKTDGRCRILRLTEKGSQAGAYLLYRHDVLNRLLRRINGSADELEQTERIEHYIDVRTVRNIDAFLDGLPAR